MRLFLRNCAKLSSSCKEIRIHLCQTSEASKGARDFVQQLYPKVKKDNPKLPILIRECSGVQPMLWVRSEFGKETSYSLTGQKSSDILKQIESL
uniref:NADH dehydrogenase [ubiquinone] 1 alpha subcomplex subunit 2 n=1 Tax=Megaselia scalaris TaxID=36166 RepID=T1H4K6_MEGSC